MDKTAAMRVMKDKYDLQLLEKCTNQLDSAYSAKVVENDSLTNRTIDLENELTVCKNDAIYKEIKHKQEIKPFKILTYVFAGVAFLIGVTKF